jgi:hypothetical protein
LRTPLLADGGVRGAEEEGRGRRRQGGGGTRDKEGGRGKEGACIYARTLRHRGLIDRHLSLSLSACRWRAGAAYGHCDGSQGQAAGSGGGPGAAAISGSALPRARRRFWLSDGRRASPLHADEARRARRVARATSSTTGAPTRTTASLRACDSDGLYSRLMGEMGPTQVLPRTCARACTLYMTAAPTSVRRALVSDKDSAIKDLRETVEILQLKVEKLEQLVRCVRARACPLRRVLWGTDGHEQVEGHKDRQAHAAIGAAGWTVSRVNSVEYRRMFCGSHPMRAYARQTACVSPGGSSRRPPRMGRRRPDDCIVAQTQTSHSPTTVRFSMLFIMFSSDPLNRFATAAPPVRQPRVQCAPAARGS